MSVHLPKIWCVNSESIPAGLCFLFAEAFATGGNGQTEWSPVPRRSQTAVETAFSQCFPYVDMGVNVKMGTRNGQNLVGFIYTFEIPN